MPDEKLVDRAVAEIGKGHAQYQYFFDHLNSPAWLDPLRARGFFQNPYKPEEKGEYVRLALWPESRYLVRMSRIPEAQEKVVEIALRIPNTENGRIQDDIADIALSVPAALSAKLVSQIAQYTETPIKVLLAEKVWALIVHLASGGQTKAALRLAAAALAVGPAGASPSRRGEPQTRFRDWYYGRIIQKMLPALLETAGLETVRLLSGLLNDAAAISGDDESGEDYLYIRVPGLELGSGGRDDVASSLLGALRNAAVDVVSRDSAKFEPVIEILRQFKWISFRRFELYLCRVFPEQGAATAEKTFHDPSILEHSSLHHEAVLLLRQVFGILQHQTREKILAWMDAGPSEEQIRRWLAWIGQPVTDENIASTKQARRRDRLAILEGQLPEEYQRVYQALVELRGAASPPDRLPIRTFGAVGSQSPKSAEELAAMSVDQVIDYLRSWKSGSDIFAPTADGLANTFASIVSDRPGEFIAAAEQFKELDPTYVRALFGGLTSSAKKGDKWGWTHALELAAWISNRPREIPGRTGAGTLIADPDWGWTRDSVLELLKAGFEGGAERLPFEYHGLVWNALAPLTRDPFPTVDDEKGPRFDPSFLSINSTRGRAMEGVIQYSGWVRTCLQKFAPDDPSPDLSAMPEVEQVLDRHLDTEYEPTLSIRSVYGQHTAWLASLDSNWFRENVKRIFPLDPKDSPYFYSAWDSFVVFNWPHNSLLPALLPAYQKAASEVDRRRTTGHTGSPENSLVEHLIAYYWRGDLELYGEDGILQDFYYRAPSSLLGHALWFVGRSASGWDGDVPPDVTARLRALVDWRLQTAEQSGESDKFEKELSNFAWWFTSGKFDERWAIDTLLRVLHLTKRAHDEMDLVKRLAELCHKYPAECVECLALLVDGDEDRWFLVSTETDARLLIQTALASQRPEAALAARRLVQHLIAKGHYSFRTLL